MRLFSVVVLLASSHAVAAEDWQLVWVTHDGEWEINKGHGILERKGDVLEGTLVAEDDHRADYRIRVELRDGKATGTFQVLSEGDEPSRLSGTYMKWARSAKHCPEQIQLVNEHEYLGLARDACEP
jgi:hypothetical protein